MICPHCGKEIENSINNITVNMPANINACNPIPTFQLFPFASVNAAASFPLDTLSQGQTFQLTYDTGTGKITQE